VAPLKAQWLDSFDLKLDFEYRSSLFNAFIPNLNLSKSDAKTQSGK